MPLRAGPLAQTLAARMTLTKSNSIESDHGLDFHFGMIFSENRFPLFGIMLQRRTGMRPTLRLYEDVLANGAEASLPAQPRMIFVVHGSVAIADRNLGDGETFNGEAAIALKAGIAGATLWRFELAADGNRRPRYRARRGVARETCRAARNPAAGRAASCAATASPFRPAAAPICIGIRGRASAACSKAAFASTPTAAPRPMAPAAPGTRPARTASSPKPPTGRRASSAS